MSSLAGCTESLPKAESFWEEFGTIKIVDDIFEPVTWHHQRRPFIRALTCKTTKTHRGVAGGASSDDQVSPIFL
jgi:hypothetical protein